MSGAVALLLLFDIDGTLLEGATRAHAEALHRSLEEVHGVRTDDLPVVNPAGRTDGEIARLLLLGAGVPVERIDSGAAAVQSACCRLYAELCPADLSEFVLPGVPETLASLAQRREEGVRLSLVTGNFEPVARLKLARAGVGHYFEPGQGGFGSDSEDRTTLPGLARRRAGSGDPYPQERTVIIGDTPRDIACARADGIRCVAVTTGRYGSRELAEADLVLPGLQDLQERLSELP